MADPTAQAIAQMFDIDLTSVPTDEAASALAIQAVSSLVTSYGELRQQLPEDDTEDDDELNDVDDDESPDEVNEDGSTDEGDDVEDDDVEPVNEQRNKKSANVPQGKPIAASFPDSLVKGLARGRIAEINGLLGNGNITPATAKKLIKKFATNESIGLSLSMDGDDGFETAVSLLQDNGPVISFAEISGNQSRFSSLGHNDGLVCDLEGEDIKDTNKNPLLADAASRNQRK